MFIWVQSGWLHLDGASVWWSQKSRFNRNYTIYASEMKLIKLQLIIRGLRGLWMNKARKIRKHILIHKAEDNAISRYRNLFLDIHNIQYFCIVQYSNTSVHYGGKILLVQYLFLKIPCGFFLPGTTPCALCNGSFNHYKIFMKQVLLSPYYRWESRVSGGPGIKAQTTWF